MLICRICISEIHNYMCVFFPPERRLLMLHIHQDFVLPSRGGASIRVGKGRVGDHGAQGMDSAMGGPTEGRGEGGETGRGLGVARGLRRGHTRPGCLASRPALRADGPVVPGAVPCCSLRPPSLSGITLPPPFLQEPGGPGPQPRPVSCRGDFVVCSACRPPCDRGSQGGLAR